MIIYESESHLNFIKIYSGNFLFIEFLDVCDCYKIFLYSMLHFLLHHQLFAQWFDDNNAFICGHCTALTNWLLPATWEPGSLPHFWWTLWKKNICVRKTFTETTAELQTLWWILLLFQFSSHYSYSSIGLLPHLLFIIIWSANNWCT